MNSCTRGPAEGPTIPTGAAASATATTAIRPQCEDAGWRHPRSLLLRSRNGRSERSRFTRTQVPKDRPDNTIRGEVCAARSFPKRPCPSPHTLQARQAHPLSKGSVAVLDRRGLEEASCECYAALRQEYERLMSVSRRRLLCCLRPLDAT